MLLKVQKNAYMDGLISSQSTPIGNPQGHTHMCLCVYYVCVVCIYIYIYFTYIDSLRCCNYTKVSDLCSYQHLCLVKTVSTYRYNAHH